MKGIHSSKKGNKASSIARLSPLVIAISAALASPVWGEVTSATVNDSNTLQGQDSVVLINKTDTTITISLNVPETAEDFSSGGLIADTSGLRIDGGVLGRINTAYNALSNYLNFTTVPVTLAEKVQTQIENSVGTGLVYDEDKIKVALSESNSGLDLTRGLHVVADDEGGLTVGANGIALSPTNKNLLASLSTFQGESGSVGGAVNAAIQDKIDTFSTTVGNTYVASTDLGTKVAALEFTGGKDYQAAALDDGGVMTINNHSGSWTLFERLQSIDTALGELSKLKVQTLEVGDGIQNTSGAAGKFKLALAGTYKTTLDTVEGYLNPPTPSSSEQPPANALKTKIQGQIDASVKTYAAKTGGGLKLEGSDFSLDTASDTFKNGVKDLFGDGFDTATGFANAQSSGKIALKVAENGGLEVAGGALKVIDDVKNGAAAGASAKGLLLDYLGDGGFNATSLTEQIKKDATVGTFANIVRNADSPIQIVAGSEEQGTGGKFSFVLDTSKEGFVSGARAAVGVTANEGLAYNQTNGQFSVARKTGGGIVADASGLSVDTATVLANVKGTDDEISVTPGSNQTAGQVTVALTGKAKTAVDAVNAYLTETEAGTLEAAVKNTVTGYDTATLATKYVLKTDFENLNTSITTAIGGYRTAAGVSNLTSLNDVLVHVGQSVKEVQNARGGKASLSARLAAMEAATAKLSTLDADGKGAIQAQIASESTDDIIAASSVPIGGGNAGKKVFSYTLAPTLKTQINETDAALAAYLNTPVTSGGSAGTGTGSGNTDGDAGNTGTAVAAGDGAAATGTTPPATTTSRYASTLANRVQGQIEAALSSYTNTAGMNAALANKADLTLSNITGLSDKAKDLIRGDINSALQTDGSGDVTLTSSDYVAGAAGAPGSIKMKFALSQTVKEDIEAGKNASGALSDALEEFNTRYEASAGTAGGAVQHFKDIFSRVADNDLSALSAAGKDVVTGLTDVTAVDPNDLVVTSETDANHKKTYSVALAANLTERVTQGTNAFAALKGYQDLHGGSGNEITDATLDAAVSKHIEDSITDLNLGTTYAKVDLGNISTDGKAVITSLITSGNTTDEQYTIQNATDIVVKSEIDEASKVKKFTYSLNPNIKTKITNADAAIADVTAGTGTTQFGQAVWSLKGLAANATGVGVIHSLIGGISSDEVVFKEAITAGNVKQLRFGLADGVKEDIAAGAEAMRQINDAKGTAQNLQARLGGIDGKIVSLETTLQNAVNAYYATKGTGSGTTTPPASAAVGGGATGGSTTASEESAKTPTTASVDVGNRLNATEAATTANANNISALDTKVTNEVARLDQKDVALDNRITAEAARLDDKKADRDLANLTDDGKNVIKGLVDVQGENGINVTSSVAPDTKTKQFKISLTNLDLGPNGSIDVGGASIDNNGIRMLETSLSQNGLKVGKVDISKEAVKVGEVSITSTGIDAASQPIRNVASGLESGGNVATNAANIGDVSRMVGASHQVLSGHIKQLEREINKVAKNADAGTASAMAVANLGQPFRPGQSAVSMGGATYSGRTGYAIGASHLFNNGRVLLKGAVNGNDRGKYGAAASATFFFD